MYLIVTIGGVAAAVDIVIAFSVVIGGVPVTAGGLVTMIVGAHLHAAGRDGDNLVRAQNLRDIVRRVTDRDKGRNVKLKVQHTSSLVGRTRTFCGRLVHVVLFPATRWRVRRHFERAVHFATRAHPGELIGSHITTSSTLNQSRMPRPYHNIVLFLFIFLAGYEILDSHCLNLSITILSNSILEVLM